MTTEALTLQDILKRSDKARLYQYRVSDEHYQALQEHLSSRYHQLKDIHTARRHGLDKAFVLYAAEWWRREYDGDWGWKELLDSLHPTLNDLSSTERVNLTEAGLKQWGLSIRKSYNEHGVRRRNALGSFLIEGGLPIHFITTSSNANNWLALLLDKALNALAHKQDPWLVIQEYQLRLPKSARHDDVLQLLTLLAQDIYDLVNTFQLYDHIDHDKDLISYLNQHNADWADTLALPLGNQAASELLAKLLISSSQTVKQLKTKPKTPNLTPSELFTDIKLVRRLSLVRTHDGYNVCLHGSIANPSFITLDEDDNHALETENYYLKFGTQQDDDLDYWLARHAYSLKQLRFQGARPIHLKSQSWANAITLTMTDSTGTLPQIKQLNPIQLPSMRAVPTDVPFLAQIDNHTDGYDARYIGSHSQSCQDDEVIVYIPRTLESSKAYSDSTRLEHLATLQQSGFDGSLYLLAGELTLGNEQVHYRLRSSTKDAYHHYILTGRQHPDFCYPTQVFFGEFHIHKHTLDGSQPPLPQTISKKDIYIRSKSNLPYRKLSEIDSSQLFGGYHLIVKNEQNEVVFGAHIGILPKGFNYKSEPKSNAFSGMLCFSSAKINKIACDDADISINPTGLDCFELSVATQLPHGKITLTLIPPLAGILKLRCHFPSDAIHICNADNELMPSNYHFCLEDALEGYRLNIISSTPLKDTRLYFQSYSDKNYNQSLPLAIHDRYYLQIPIYGFADQARSFLHLSAKGLDETVKLLLGNRIQPLCSFSYYRYELDLDTQHHHLYLVPKNTQYQYAYRKLNQDLLHLGNTIELIAVNFCNPTDIRPLMRCEHLYWDLTKLHDSDDIWFIYPSHDGLGLNHIRPIAYAPACHSEHPKISIEPLGELGLAAKLPYKERQELIYQLLKQMATNFDHNGWQYIKTMADACPDITLICFDHFKIARTIPEFLMAAQCLFEELPLVHTIHAQLHSPWELMSIDVFEAVLQAYKTHRLSKVQAILQSNQYDDNIRQQLIAHATSGLPKIIELQPVCQLMFKLLEQPDNTPMTLELIEHIVNHSFEQRFVSIPKSHSPIGYCDKFAQLIQAAYQKIPDAIRPKPKDWHKNIMHYYGVVYCTPIVLAWLSCQKSSEIRQQLQTLPNFCLDIYITKSIDTPFFNDCYDYCLRWFYHHCKA